MMTPEVMQPPPHSKRVQAWVYAIINPVIESLRLEVFLLDKGNTTWEGDTRRCEYIRPIREYFQYSQWPNYEDFLADSLNLGFREKFEEHDRGLSEVESSAAEFADGLMHSDAFRKKVKDSLEQYQSTARSNPQYPYLDDMPEGILARGNGSIAGQSNRQFCRTITGRTSFGKITRKTSNLTATIHPFRP